MEEFLDKLINESSYSTFERSLEPIGRENYIKVVKRNTIKDIPSESEEDYYVFKIEGWDKLCRKIEVRGYQVRRLIYTTEYLLHNVVIVTELCIKSKEEYRLWRELRRVSSLTETEIGGSIDKDSRIKGFSIEGIRIFIKDEEIRV
ncbi:hypothetical protein [Clostridium estertheticum]|nr:hypothetical protein [Clostridium estertheticum]MBU3217349.1 hypothetical protein [Clostridium estertheticum]